MTRNISLVPGLLLVSTVAVFAPRRLHAFRSGNLKHRMANFGSHNVVIARYAAVKESRRTMNTIATCPSNGV